MTQSNLWSESDAQNAYDMASEGSTVQDIALALGRNAGGVRQKLAERGGWKAISANARLHASTVPHVQTGPLDPRVKVGSSDKPDDVRRLVEACRRGPQSLADVCNALDCSPKRALAALGQARDQGFTVDLTGDAVAWRDPSRDETEVTAKVAPVVGDEHMIGVISDTHFGSKWCKEAELEDFIGRAYDRGVRTVVHAGDMLAGQNDKTIRWDLDAHGLDAQCAAAFEGLPKRDGLTYHFIDGNHDEHFWMLSGQVTGQRLVEYFNARGRHDVVYCGARGGKVLLKSPVCKRPIVVKLWHPKSGKSYAVSYHPQNAIRDMAPGLKPDILVCGHWHTFCYFEQRGIHALCAGTFEGPESSFSQSLGGAVALGGTILSFALTKHGTLRDVGIRRSSYYVNEHAREIEVMPAGTRIERDGGQGVTAALDSLRSALSAFTGSA
jgi:predicted phosphodiesterase